MGLQPGTLTLIGLSCLCTTLGYSLNDIGLRFWLNPATVPHADIFALMTNTFTAVPSTLFGLILLAGLGVYFYQDAVRSAWRSRRNSIILGVIALLSILYGIDAVLGQGVGAGLLSDVVLLIWFGTVIERTWGTRRFLIFCAVTTGIVNLVAGHIAWLFPGSFEALLSQARAPVGGASVLIDALMALWCLMQGRRRLALFNIEARTLVWVLVIINGLEIIFRGVLAGMMGIMAIGLAHLLVSGTWRPRQLLDRVRLWRIERRMKKRRRNIRLVDNDRTLHTQGCFRIGDPSNG